MKFTFLSLFFISIAILSCNKALVEESPQMQPEYELTFKQLPTSWDEAIPLGNATIGALVWEKDGKLRFSLDRADLWDLRPMANLDFENYDFAWVRDQWEKDTYMNVQDRYDVPYNQLPAPSKIPGGALEFDISGFGEVEYVKLKLADAVCEVKWKNGALLKTFVHATEPIAWYAFENVPDVPNPQIVPPPYFTSEAVGMDNPVTGQDLRRLEYEQGEIQRQDNSNTYTQKGWSEFEFQVHTQWGRSEQSVFGAWSISSQTLQEDDQPTATTLVDNYFAEGMDESMQSHTEWWHEFWGRSSVSIPDSTLQQQYYMEMYKLGSAARQGAPPISLQSVWTADNGKLPPWKGDYHHDLNTQLSYWPTYAGNHLALETGFLDWLIKYKPAFKEYTREYYGTNGLNVPGVTTLEGEPMGGWIQYAFGPTVSAWLGQHFYLHWRYSMDKDFLEKEAYPWINDVAIYFEELSILDENGMRKLPLSASPELHNNSREAWFGQMTNFDLALVRWTYTAAAELATELGNTEDASKWKAGLSEWPELAIDQTGLQVAPGQALTESHRHFSHLMAIHPLGLIDVSDGEKEKEIISNTITNLEKTGSSQWVGYSFSWLGNLYARNLDGEGAARALTDFATSFVLPNSFHVNGDQSGTGKSNFTYRPFTLEGNFAYAAGIQEMLIQSHTGTVRIFPAIPASWKDVSFRKLRTEGAFLVSATMENGVVESVEIVSERGGEMRLQNPFDSRDISTSGQKPIKWEGNTLILNTILKEEIILKPTK